MRVTEVRVDLPEGAYVISVGGGALDGVGELAPPPATGQAAAVVADETTGELFGERAVDSLGRAGWRPHLVTVPPGEASKTLATATQLYGQLADAGLDRASAVFALGGGVVGDLGGFVAATYLRGIDFVTVPTTLLAQVDSSVGGKVGVDLPRGKNLVGAFHQPGAVVIDPQTLASLPEREFAAGLAEVVKHAAIADKALFSELDRRAAEIADRDPALLTDVVARNCRIKASVVSRDPEERRGLRAVLNYGHTIGHAIERGASEWGIRHGEAVAVGMIAEARAASRLGLSREDVASCVEGLLRKLGVPTSVPPGRIDAGLAVRALRADKKIIRGRLSLPVVPRIGSVEVTGEISVESLIEETEGLLT